MRHLPVLLLFIEILGAHISLGEVMAGIPFNYDKVTQPPSASSIITKEITNNTPSPNSQESMSSATTPPPPPPPPPATTTPASTTTTTTTTTMTTTTAASFWVFSYNKECLKVYLVAGGLIIACTVLLISTLVLSCKVCELSRRLKKMNSNGDLISNSEYWIGTAKKDKRKPDEEVKETTVLLTDLTQTQENANDSATKEEVVKVNENGQEEENKKEVGDTATATATAAPTGQEASADDSKQKTPVTAAEDSSPSKPQESPSTKAEAASSSETPEEPKNVA